MQRSKNNPFQYRGYFDATKLTIGLHSVTVSVITDSYGETKNEFYIADVPCEIGEEDEGEIVTRDAGVDTYGDIPEDIIISDISNEDINDLDISMLDSLDNIDEVAHQDMFIIDESYDFKTYDKPVFPDVGGTRDFVILRPDDENTDGGIEAGCSCSSIQ